MAQRVVGGGERFVKHVSIPLSGVNNFKVVTPPGADLAVIQPQLNTTPLYRVLIRRHVAPTLAENEYRLEDGDVVSDCYPSGRSINGLLVNSAGGTVTGGTLDYVQINFYSNLAGRLGNVPAEG